MSDTLGIQKLENKKEETKVIEEKKEVKEPIIEKINAPTKIETKVEAIGLKVPDFKRPSMGMTLGLKSLNNSLKSLEKPLNMVEND